MEAYSGATGLSDSMSGGLGACARHIRPEPVWKRDKGRGANQPEALALMALTLRIKASVV